jgi:hypothetical protein
MTAAKATMTASNKARTAPRLPERRRPRRAASKRLAPQHPGRSPQPQMIVVGPTPTEQLHREGVGASVLVGPLEQKLDGAPFVVMVDRDQLQPHPNSWEGCSWSNLWRHRATWVLPPAHLAKLTVAHSLCQNGCGCAKVACGLSMHGPFPKVTPCCAPCPVPRAPCTVPCPVPRPVPRAPCPVHRPVPRAPLYIYIMCWVSFILQRRPFLKTNPSFNPRSNSGPTSLLIQVLHNKDQ